MELPAFFDPIDFKKFTDGKTIVKDTDMDPLVENEAKLHITNGIEKASTATGVDIKVSIVGTCLAQDRRAIAKTETDFYFLRLGCLQNRERTDGPPIWSLVPLCDG
eukprot:Macronucleus_8580.p3 GENE.Macronucleus_8580~~Macronucleus_8580.p3  ORF type:complete len:106 (+),score=8.16 Macronucleus_8580:1-318(+)